MRPLDVRRLGIVPYAEALDLQRALTEERRHDRISDTLLLLQHPAVITLGVKGDGGRSHIVATPERLQVMGIGIHETGRGGDITYHGPGQLVGYPILDLKPDRQDVHRYVRDLEDVMMRVCADYGIEAGRIAGCSGSLQTYSRVAANRQPHLFASLLEFVKPALCTCWAYLKIEPPCIIQPRSFLTGRAGGIAALGICKHRGTFG